MNQQIKETEVRLIGEDGEQLGVVSIGAALDTAAESSMDLVEISPNAKPPVCKVMNYGKYKFQLSKKKSEAKKKQKQIQLKEIKFRPGTEQGDFDVKKRKIINFLEKSCKVKVTVRFRGREMMHQSLGVDLLKRLQAELEELVSVDQEPKLEGRQMVMMLSPKKV